MIAFLYRMRVKPGREHDFDRAWREGTRIARERFGSDGSHLFALDDGTRLAIALWPDRESRERYFAWRRANPTPASQNMADAVDEDLGEEALMSIDNLWVAAGG